MLKFTAGLRFTKNREWLLPAAEPDPGVVPGFSFQAGPGWVGGALQGITGGEGSFNQGALFEETIFGGRKLTDQLRMQNVLALLIWATHKNVKCKSPFSGKITIREGVKGRHLHRAASSWASKWMRLGLDEFHLTLSDPQRVFAI